MSTPALWERALPVLRNWLVRRARRLGVDPASAEDLAQEALFEAWRLRGRVYDPTGMDRLVDAIFTNVYRRWAKRTGRDQTARSGMATSEEEVADDYDLEVELEHSELVDLLDRALGLLPAETRDVLIGRFVEEASLGELAGRLGVEPGALRMRLQRGKLALRRVLTTTYGEEAVSLGLMGETDAGWQETRIWCPGCGAARLQGRFSGARRGVEFGCGDDHGSWWVVESDTSGFGVTGFRATLKKIGGQAYDFWLGRLRGDDAHPHPRTVTWDDHGVRAGCSACGDFIRTGPTLQALFTPDGRRFWRDHPRIRTVACRQIEVEGAPAVLTSFQSVTSRACLDVVLARDSFGILRSDQS